jgi:hypothetical protein
LAVAVKLTALWGVLLIIGMEEEDVATIKKTNLSLRLCYAKILLHKEGIN